MQFRWNVTIRLQCDFLSLVGIKTIETYFKSLEFAAFCGLTIQAIFMKEQSVHRASKSETTDATHPLLSQNRWDLRC